MHIPYTVFIDIVLFQFGTFEGGSNGFWYDAAISFLGAFLGLLAGYGVYLWSKRNGRFDRLRHASYLSKSIINYTSSQINNCKKLAKAYEDNPTKQTLMAFDASSDLKRMAERFDQGEFYHAYLTKYQRKQQSFKEFAELYTYLDFIDIQIDELRSFIEKEMLALNRRMNEYKRYVEESLTKANMTITHVMQGLGIHPQFRVIVQQYHDGHNDPTDLPYTYQNFILALKNFIIHNVAPHPVITDLLNTLNTAEDHYKGILLSAASFAKDLDQIAASLDKALNGFITCTEKVRNDYPINVKQIEPTLVEDKPDTP